MSLERRMLEIHEKAKHVATLWFIRKRIIPHELSEIIAATTNLEALSKYNPDQPRVPAGNPDGGQWTSGDSDGDEDGSAIDATDENGGSSEGQSTPNNSEQEPSVNNNVTPVDYQKPKYDVDGAVNYLNDSADKLKRSQIAEGNQNYFGSGACAHYVADAIEKGGGMPVSIRPDDARNFGSWLENNNFGAVAAWDGGETLSSNGYVSGYTPETGDVAVIQPYEGGNPSGHMAMYNGSQWVSDFRQRDIWGGPGYRGNKPDYIIYRFGVLARSL